MYLMREANAKKLLFIMCTFSPYGYKQQKPANAGFAVYLKICLFIVGCTHVVPQNIEIKAGFFVGIHLRGCITLLKARRK